MPFVLTRVDYRFYINQKSHPNHHYERGLATTCHEPMEILGPVDCRRYRSRAHAIGAPNYAT